MTHHTLKPQIDELRSEHARIGQRISNLEGLCRISAGRCNRYDLIAQAVSEAFGVELIPMIWKLRGSAAICEARLAAMAIMYEHIDNSTMGEVSSYFGKTHCTIINAIKTTNNLRETDPDFRRRYESVMQRVKSLTE